jgi:hypothetical protein
VQRDFRNLTGKTIAGRHVLTEFRNANGDRAWFLTADGGIAEVAPVDSPDAVGLTSAARVAHPNLLRVLDSGTEMIDDLRLSFRITERPEDSVAEVLTERSLTEEETRQVVESIVPALGYLHDNGFVHGAVRPESIVAVGNTVKLTLDSIRPGDAASARRDIVDLGRTVVELLTQQRPEGNAEAAARLPVPFGPIAGGTIAHGWTLDMVRRALAGQSVAFPPGPAPDLPAAVPPDASPGRAAIADVLRSKPLILAAGALAVVLLVFALTRTPEHPRPATPVVVSPPDPRPSPVAAREPVSAPASERSRATSSPGGGYAVIAATYGNQAAAEKRAESFRKAWTQSEVSVKPNGRYYVVVLATGVTKDEAERIQRQARSAGLPRDTHVTKITR